MKTYIGTKIVKAFPCKQACDDDGYRVFYADGYESWSPKEVFERCYREITNEEANMAMDVVDPLREGLRNDRNRV